MKSETHARKAIIDACLKMNASGLNQGTSGNISVRFGDRMLISPSATPYDQLKPEMIASIELGGEMTNAWEGPLRPSVEWRFHWLLMKSRPDLTAIVHAHPPYCTTLAILREPIPACHYMIAAFGGTDVRCSGYHTFGTIELAELAVEAMRDRTACLLANHGMIAGGASLEQAMWRATELETIARQYCLSRQLGDPVILSDDQIGQTLQAFQGYGVQET